MDDVVPFVSFRPWLPQGRPPSLTFGFAIDDRPFHLLDQVGHRNTAWAGIRAVEDGAAAPDAFTLAQDTQAFRAALVAAVEDEAVRIYD